MAGERGPRPLPATVHLLRGNPSKLSPADLRRELQPPTEIPDCPAELQAGAREEWDRVCVELSQLGLVSRIDRAVLAFYCAEWGRWQWAEAKIAELNRDDPKGERGLIDRAPSGYRMQSVYLQISRKAQENCLRFAAEFGMTPSARSRVTPGEAGQLGLPGVEAQPQASGLGSFARR